jgi:aminobenzoyl-glutamate utilization protein B
MAVSAWELFNDPKLIAEAKQDHQRRLAGRKYQSLLEPNQEPPLDYRDPPKRK